MSKAKPSYGNESISALKGADRVRKRPGVIFGSDGLEGCDHAVFSTAQSSIPALQAALEAVRPGGVVSAILYSGQVIGTDEKQTVLEYLRALPLKSFTVLVCDFANWAETAPLPCIILKK